MAMELDTSRKNLIRRLKELDQFKHSGSVQKDEIENFQKFIKTLEQDSKKKKKKRSVNESEKIESLKIVIKTLNKNLDKCEERFRKYNIPKRYRNGQKQPLKDYIQRLQEFMEITWRKETKNKREKGYLTLQELMGEIHVTKSNGDGLIAFNSLRFSLEEIATQISNLLIQYLFSLMLASNASNEIVSRNLDELLTIIECLSLEESDYSVVKNMFVEIIRFFIDAMELAGPFWDDENKISLVKKTAHFDKEMEDDVVHCIVAEILRLEVSFCSPEFVPMMFDNDVLFSMSVHLKSNVFEEKLERVEEKINEWMFDIEFVQKCIHEDYFCSEMKFLRQVLEAGAYEIFTEHDKSSWCLVNLVSL
ncbi:hypothetical protein CsatA_024169 [Cannabis sativa]